MTYPYTEASIHSLGDNVAEQAFSGPARPCVREIGWLSFSGLLHDGALIMLAGYFDDSGTHDDSQVVVWGGFVGSIDQWADFERAWLAKLRVPLEGKPPLKKFGLADCARGRNEFFGYSEPERDMVRKEFRDIIISSGVVGLSYAVDRIAWDHLATGAAKAHFGTAEMMCFGGCITGAVEAVRAHYPGKDEISLHFDKGRRSTGLQGLIDIVEKTYQDLPRISSFAFDDVASFAPLQAADTIATENYWFAKQSLDSNFQATPMPHFRRFLENVRANGFILDTEMIRQTLKDNGF